MRIQRILSVVVFFTLWEILGRLNAVENWFNPVFFPPPSTIVTTDWQLAQQGILWPSLEASTERIVLGFLLGCGLAVILSIFMDRAISLKRIPVNS